MRNLNLVIFFAIISNSLFAQDNIPLINSGEVIKEAIELHDSGQYQKAIQKYLTIDRSDTNYIYMLSELGLTYTKDKKFDEAIKVLNEALTEPSRYKANIYGNLATAWDEKGNSDSAIAIYKRGLALYPYHYLLWFNLGVTYSKAKKYKEAIEAFQQDITNNPFHFGGHAALGKLMARQGQFVHAMMSMETAIIIDPGSNRANALLTYLNNFVNNALDDKEEKIDPFTENKNFEETDQLLKAGIAMNQGYKCRVKFNAPVVKQTQLLFDKFNFDPKSEDFWMKYYGSFYDLVKSKQYTDHFISELLSSVKAAAPQVQKSAPYIKDMNALIGDKMREVALVKTIKENGVETKYQCYLDRKTNMLLSIGNYQSDSKSIRDGKWRFYFSNGELDTEGSYDGDGKRTGKWTSYNEDGSKLQETNYSHGMESGEYKTYHPNGNLSVSAVFNDGSVEGVVNYYFRCGALKSEITFAKSKKNGKAKQYYKSGQVAEDYNFNNDSLTGDYITYFPDGKKKAEYKYRNNELNGKAITYYRNGKIQSELIYKNSKLEGPYKSFYQSGNLYATLSYKNGFIVGPYKRYWDDGKTLWIDQTANSKGDINGEFKEYNNTGELYYTMIYKNGKIKSQTFYDKKGQIIENTPKISSAPVKGYFTNGRPLYEGKYAKGLRNGTWTYFYPAGNKKKVLTYEKDKLNGPYKIYYYNGTLKIEGNYKADQLEGYYISYHPNGKKSSEGWYVNGEKEGKWISYFPSGVIDDIEYYYQGDLHGYCQNYSVDGKLMKNTKYTYGNIETIEGFDQTGKTYFKDKFTGKNDFIDKFPSGQIRKKAEYNCNSFGAKFIYYYKNGSIDDEYSYLNNVKDGPFIRYYKNGKIHSEGFYQNNELTGWYKNYYKEGGLAHTGSYVDGEKDSTWTYYYKNGKIKKMEVYKSGDLMGMSKNYDQNGELLYQIFYDEINSQYYQYVDKTGNMTDPIYLKDSCELTIYYKNGTVAARHNVRNGIFCGKQIIYYPNGKVYNEYFLSYANNLVDDYNKYYYENGKLKSSEYYINGDLHETSKYYREDGSLESSCEYNYGYLHGNYNHYDKNGKITKTEKYWSGIEL